MNTIFAATVCLALMITAASAQQPCKAFYPLGETAPAGCVKTFDKWGTGQSVAPDPHGAPGDAYEKTFLKPQAPVYVPRALGPQ